MEGYICLVVSVVPESVWIVWGVEFRRSGGARPLIGGMMWKFIMEVCMADFQVSRGLDWIASSVGMRRVWFDLRSR